MRPPVAPGLRLPGSERSFRRPVILSAGAHLLLVLLLLWQADRREFSTQPAPGGPGPLGGGGGGERVTYLALAAQPSYREPRAVVRPPIVPLPRVQVEDVPRMRMTTQVVPVMVTVAGGLSGAGAVAGGGIGAGLGLGTGNAAGPGSGGGGGDLFPPQARYSILPPLPKPAAVRGRVFRVHFWVDVNGRVTRVEVTPTMPDAEYRKKFLELMYQYTFSPAVRLDGTPAAGETVLTITL